MSDVFDILMRIGITDEITHVLRDIGGHLEDIGRLTSDLTGSFSALAGTMGTLGTALTTLGAAAIFGLNAIGKQGDELMDVFGRMKALGYEQREINSAMAESWKTTLAVPTTLLEENMNQLIKLKEITGSMDVAKTVLTPLAQLQEIANVRGKGGTADIMELFRIFTSYGMKPEQAIARIGREAQLWEGGVVTPATSLQNIKQMGALGEVATTDFRNRILPLLETLMPSGARMNVGRGLQTIFEDALKTGKFGESAFSRYLLPGQTVRGISNDPYALAQAMARGMQALHPGIDFQDIKGQQLVLEELRKLNITSPAAQRVMQLMIERGEAAMGARSPFAQAPPGPYDPGKAFTELLEEGGEARKAMFQSITGFIQELGLAVDKWEVPHMLDLTKTFQGWTEAIRAIPEDTMNRIISTTAGVAIALTAFGTAMLTLYGISLLFTPASAAIIGLGLLANAAREVYLAWDKNKSPTQNMGEIYKQMNDQMAEQDKAINAWVRNTGRELIDALMAYGWKNAFMDVASFIGSQLVDAIKSLMPSWTKAYTDADLSKFPRAMPLNPLMDRGPTGGIGVLPPRPAPTGPNSNDKLNDQQRFEMLFGPRTERSGMASPASYTPGGSITPRSSEGRAKGMTIATSLNIDGRLLAELVTQHVVEMLSDPSSASAPDWLSTPHGAGSGYSAA